MLGRLVTVLALSDLLTSLWNYVPNWAYNRSVWEGPGVPWCGLWIAGIRLGQLWSVIISGCIALAIFAAVLKKPAGVQALWHAPLWSLPVAILLNLAYVLYPSRRITEGVPQPYCSSPEVSENVFAAELVATCLLILALHGFSYSSMRKCAPDSVVRRSFVAASHYLSAFSCTWAPYVISILLLRADVVSADSCSMFGLQITRDICYSLNGLFNLVVHSHIRTMEPLVVTFREEESVVVGDAAESVVTGSRSTSTFVATGLLRQASRMTTAVPPEWQLLILCDSLSAPEDTQPPYLQTDATGRMPPGQRPP